MGLLPATLGAPHILSSPEAGRQPRLGRGWDGGVGSGGAGGWSLSGAGKSGTCEKSVSIFRGSGVVSERNKPAGWKRNTLPASAKRPD